MKKIIFFAAMMVAVMGNAQVDLYNGLFAYYPLDGNLNDGSGTGNDIIPSSGGPLVTYSTDRFGNNNNSYLASDTIFQGVINSYDPDNAYSAVVWYKTDTILGCNLFNWIGATQGTVPDVQITKLEIRDKDALSPDTTYLIAGHRHSCIGTPPESFGTTYKNVDIYDGQWHMITFLRNGNSEKVYFDTTLVSDIIKTYSGCATGAQLNRLGFAGGKGSRIDDIMLYSRNILKAEIDSIFNLQSQLSSVVSTSKLENSKFEFNVYPNPFEAVFQLEMSISSSFDVNIFDVNGRQIYFSTHENNSPILINTSSWSTGVYYIKVISDTGEFATKKIVKY